MADAIGLEIMEEEDLRERKLGDLHEISFADAKRKLYADRNFSLPGGESSRDAQSRAIKVINNILDQYAGKRVVIGTHGDIMTLMLNHFDARFAYEFWQGTSMPDIYRADFEQGTLVNIARLWNEE
ncbi:histidine phosphatase family protein [Paenibacillus sp. JCM 10914]|uniref:histidine phosphatase family protein n=1 Tax=Paenibacillus sp. JCM 10914 TaxID=1236974 RepID=UPI0003CC5B13|nr:phosphoglycerate mutase family 2 [Paenibacillus sp. JCM 10914]